MERKLTFNSGAENYDRFRPEYSGELYRDIFSYSGVRAGDRALEVGIGTGKATKPFLERGCRVTAVEIGDKLAAFAREKYADRDNLEVVCGAFEDFPEDEKYDLIYSATAFHWIPAETGYAKARRMLREGGTLALFWNKAFAARPDDPLHREIQRIYAKYRPEAGIPTEFDEKKYELRKGYLREYGFQERFFRLYHGERAFDAEEYICHLRTHSDHQMMEPKLREAFEEELKAAVRGHGGKMRIYDTMELYMGKNTGISKKNCEK